MTHRKGGMTHGKGDMTHRKGDMTHMKGDMTADTYNVTQTMAYTQERGHYVCFFLFFKCLKNCDGI